MKSVIKSAFLFFTSMTIAGQTSAQYLASKYKPQNKTEKLVLEKLYALPEIKEHLRENKSSHPDMLINTPYASSTYYAIQVGFDLTDRFATSYYLYVNSKTLVIYYNDFLDESGSKLITLKTWRRWRNNTVFNDNHAWKNGRLILVKYPSKQKPTK